MHGWSIIEPWNCAYVLQIHILIHSKGIPFYLITHNLQQNCYVFFSSMIHWYCLHQKKKKSWKKIKKWTRNRSRSLECAMSRNSWWFELLRAAKSSLRKEKIFFWPNLLKRSIWCSSSPKDTRQILTILHAYPIVRN